MEISDGEKGKKGHKQREASIATAMGDGYECSKGNALTSKRSRSGKMRDEIGHNFLFFKHIMPSKQDFVHFFRWDQSRTR